MCKVGCAGILVADFFCGPLEKVPREGNLVVVDKIPMDVGGCAANVAVDLGRQGVQVELLGCLGDDAEGRFVESLMARQGINCDSLLFSKSAPTSKTIILLIEGEDRRFIHMLGANCEFATDNIRREWLRSLEVFYLGGLFAMPGLDMQELAELFRFCREHKVTTVVDVVLPQDFDQQESLKALLPFIDCFMPNDEEATQITGHASPLEQLHWFSNVGANTVVTTRGVEGVFALHEGQFWQANSYDFSAVDPSGAGDAFVSGFIVSVLRGWSMPEMLSYASATGGSVVRNVGATTNIFSFDEAERYAATHPLKIECLGPVQQNCQAAT